MGGGTTDGQNSRPQPSRKKPTEFCNTFPLKADIARDLFMVGPPGQYLKRSREPAHGCLSIPE